MTHRRNRDRARRTTRVTALAGAVAATAGVLVAVPFLSGAGAATAAPGSPVGVAEHMFGVPGGLRFSGWARDPDTTKTSYVYVTVDGKRSTAAGAITPANRPRPDLRSTHPEAVDRGYYTVVAIPAGRHTVCTNAQNSGSTPGDNVPLRCLTTTFNYNPVGALGYLTLHLGHVRVNGWAYDSDAPTTPVKVGVSIDGHTTTATADDDSPAAARAYPAGGAAHGFNVAVPAAQGAHTVCVTFYNTGYGANTTARCVDGMLNDSPLGHVDTLARQGTGIRLRGWAFDPDTASKPMSVQVSVDGTTRSLTASGNRPDVHAAHPYAGSAHGFDTVLAVGEGTHKVCVTLPDTGYGSTVALPCQTVTVSYSPHAYVTSVTPTSLGLGVFGYAYDPDTSKAVNARLWVSHTDQAATVPANQSAHGGHAFGKYFTARSGRQTVCAVAYNVGYGSHNSTASCKTITLALAPVGRFEAVSRVGDDGRVQVTGWGFDPDSTAASKYAVTVDGHRIGDFTTTVHRSDVTRLYPMAGTTAPHGFAGTFDAPDGEHTICVTLHNVGAGAEKSLGCRTVNAVHPNPPSAPRSVSATATYGAATVHWAAPASDGGAPVSYYTVTAGSTTVKLPATATSYTASKLAAKTRYTFTVRAVNAGGTSAGSAISVTTPSGPAPQTTPAPVSTSRYIRNIRGSSASDLATMRREGVADAQHNPSGHRYMVLLDIGGQDQYDGGVILSATTRFVSYGDLVRAVNAYVDGYHSAQKSTAPVTVAVGTNNDVDVSATSGKQWADQVIDPIRSYAARYGDIAIAGANDIEPGFRAGYSATSSWVKGYLANTTAGFVFNGSADGCAYSVTDRSCNNGWTMRGLYNTAQGFAPGRIVNLPQVYNTTMAAQWKYISLTGIQYKQPRIVFGGPLTEYTACAQARSCGSLGGSSAWREMWNNLQSDSRLRVTSLPYSTDLRIDS